MALENSQGFVRFPYLVAFVDVDDGFRRVANNEDDNDSGQECGHGPVPPEYHVKYSRKDRKETVRRLLFSLLVLARKMKAFSNPFEIEHVLNSLDFYKAFVCRKKSES